uniref:Histone deacetylase domain-containing protein n=1 Tax=Acrobeloides nanus TaxID=290746 RepID=A0A914E9C9_9BILA
MGTHETYLITDSDGRMRKHRCEWDPAHIERPERLDVILSAIKSSGLLKECVELDPVMATDNDVMLVHSSQYLSRLKEITDKTQDEQEDFCSQYEDIYLNSHTLEAAYLSVGSSIQATETVLKGSSESRNAFALVRPPGHHAYDDQGCGFCIFNNVAICAKWARKKGLSRVLIVDWDVHAGQGTQYCIEDDPGIKLVSIHRYQSGKFWPNLPESAIQTKYKNTINVPLNDTGYGDAEYFAFMNFLVRPIIDAWKPELVLVSCGFDAALGDPEGEMEVSPAGYGHLTGLLSSLDIPLCLLLEGGYFLESIAQDAVHSLRALIERRPSPFPLAETSLKPSFLESLFSTIYFQRNEFQLLDEIYSVLELFKTINKELKDEYQGVRQLKLPHQTRGLYPPRVHSTEDHYRARLKKICEAYENHLFPKPILDIQLKSHGMIFKTSDEDDFQIAVSSRPVAVFIFFLCLPMLSFEFDVQINSNNWYCVKLEEYLQAYHFTDDSLVKNSDVGLKKLFEHFPSLQIIFS